MKSVLEQVCPQCGAELKYNPAIRKLECGYCNFKKELNLGQYSASSVAKDFRFEDFRKGYEQPDAAKLPIYHCNNCGAELIAPAEQISLTCPYCRSNVVLTDKVSGNLRPNGVIPFEITPDQLPKLLRDFYKDKKLLPRSFFSQASMKGVTGVYAPFWLFSGIVDGEATFITSKVHSYRDGSYSVKETSYYERDGQVHAEFSDVPVDASVRLSDKIMDSLEPFDMSKAKPFDMGYLAGFAADRFDAPAKDVEERAKKRIENTAEGIFTSQCGAYDSARRIGSGLDTRLDAKYYLFPVYTFHLKYMDRQYRFAVNGQTGKVVGELPDFKDQRKWYFLKRFGAVAGSILLVFIVKYFLGG